MAGEYEAPFWVYSVVFALLAGAGMERKDVRGVPAADVATGANAAIQGHADATPFAIGAARATEANASNPRSIRRAESGALEIGRQSVLC